MEVGVITIIAALVVYPVVPPMHTAVVEIIVLMGHAVAVVIMI